MMVRHFGEIAVTLNDQRSKRDNAWLQQLSATVNKRVETIFMPRENHRIAITLAIAVLIAPVAAYLWYSAAQIGNPTPQEYAVYRALLPHIAEGSKKRIVAQTRTSALNKAGVFEDKEMRTLSFLFKDNDGNLIQFFTQDQ